MAAMALTTTLISFAQLSAADRIVELELDFWTYEVRTTVSGIQVTGSITYTIIGQDALVVDGAKLQVDVFKTTGHFEGNTTVAGLNRSVVGAYDGYRFEVQGTPSVVRDELTTIESFSEGYGTLQEASSVTSEEVVSYSPPLMFGFDPHTAEVGVAWNESVEISRFLSYDDGTDAYDSDDVSVDVISYRVVSVGVEDTDAGSFSVVRILRTLGLTNETLWYSEDAGRLVRFERCENGSEDPSYMAILTGYSYEGAPGGNDTSALLTGILAASLVLLVVAVVIALVRVRRRSERIRDGESQTASVKSTQDGDEGLGLRKED